MNPVFPKQLSYMEPFIRYLDSLPADELNEDVDPTILEEALRDRLACDDPDSILASDVDALENWLDSFDSDAHPAHWVQGFLFGLTAAELFELNDDGPPPPEIKIKPKFGWTASNRNSELRKGKSLAILLPLLDDFGADLLRQQLEQPLVMTPVFTATRTASDAEYGNSKGRKYVYHQTSPREATRIDYILSVPGGLVIISVSEMDRDFNHEELEASLGTLSVGNSTA
jgi:hypothetical protein